MPEQLSQSQIDALLAQMSSGEAPAEEEKGDNIKEYDFTSPKKFTKEQLKTFDSIHETFSRIFSSYLSGLLRAVCDVEVMQVEEQRYYEYNNALADSALIGILDFKPESQDYNDSVMLMDIDTNMGFYLIDKLLGGPGTKYDLLRDYTEIELAILDNIIIKITETLQGAWQNSMQVDIALNNIETNSRMLQVFEPDDIIVIVITEITVDGHKFNLSICLAADSVEEFVDSLSVKYTKSSKKQDPDKEQAKKRMIIENVFESDMEMKVIFDEFTMDLRDVLQLQPEDIIPLNKGLNENVFMRVDGIPWFTAKLGETKGKKSVKLNKPLK